MSKQEKRPQQTDKEGVGGKRVQAELQQPVGSGPQANPRNARTHDDKQIDQIIASTTRLGFTNPLPIDEHGITISGHRRLAAAIRLGLEVVPVTGWRNSPVASLMPVSASNPTT